MCATDCWSPAAAAAAAASLHDDGTALEPLGGEQSAAGEPGEGQLQEAGIGGRGQCYGGSGYRSESTQSAIDE